MVGIGRPQNFIDKRELVGCSADSTLVPNYSVLGQSKIKWCGGPNQLIILSEKSKPYSVKCLFFYFTLLPENSDLTGF